MTLPSQGLGSENVSILSRLKHSRICRRPTRACASADVSLVRLQETSLSRPETSIDKLSSSETSFGTTLGEPLQATDIRLCRYPVGPLADVTSHKLARNMI